MKQTKYRGRFLLITCMVLLMIKPDFAYAETVSDSDVILSDDTISADTVSSDTVSDDDAGQQENPGQPEEQEQEVSGDSAVGQDVYRITYVLNDGVNDSENPEAYSGENEIVLKAASREYHTFAGWYKDEKLTKRVKRINKGSKGDLTLYAKWKPYKYTIQFQKNGKANGSMQKLGNRLYGKSYTLPKVKFKRKGYAFDGWNTKSDGTGTSYANEAEIENLSMENNGVVVLYAQWQIETYQIAYELNGGITTSQQPDSYTVSSDTIVLPVPEKTGYSFGGWFTNARFKNKIARISKGSAGDKTLYAKWRGKSYVIHYNLDGGKNHKKNRTKYTPDTDTFALNTPTKTGSSFEGWYTDSSFTNRITEITQGSTTNYELYAKWNTLHYSIQFCANGGKGSLPGIECVGAEKYTLPICGFARNGYYCVAWNTQADGHGKSYGLGKGVRGIASADGETVQLHAVWRKFDGEEISMAKEVVAAVNRERTRAGLSKLTADPDLMAIAQQRVWETSVYWSHTRPDKSDWYEIYETAGYSRGSAGENIAKGYESAGSVMEGWMNSPGHKANILGKDYRRIGVGCYYCDGKYYWVQNFSD